MTSTDIFIPREPIRIYGGKHALTNEHRQVEVPAGATIAEALEISIASTGLDWPPDRFVATVNDVRVPREYWERVRPKPGTLVVFRPVASGDDALRTVLFLGIAVAALFIAPFIAGTVFGLTGAALSAGTALIGGAITLGGALLLNALMPLRPAQQDTGQPKTLPMISGASNEARPWGSVPVVLGKHRLSPMYAAMPYSFFAGDKQYMNLVFCLGYGPLAISDLRIGDTAIGNFEEIQTEKREGRAGDADLSLFPSIVNEQPLGLTIKASDNQVIRSTDINRKTTIISIDVIAPNGIWQYNTKTGAYDDRPVGVQIYYANKNVPGWNARPQMNFTRDRDPIIKGDQWDVPAGVYDVRVQKMGADYTGTEQVSDTIVWNTLRGFETGHPIKFKKPLALVSMRARSTDQFNGVINTFNCIVSSYVKHWNGVYWEDNVFSNNPGDLFRHVLQGPANARPRTDAQLDFPSIEDWVLDCYSRGYTYNAVISDQRTVRDVISDIAAAGRATVALRNGKWGVSFPRDNDPVSWHFTPRNSSDFKSSRVYREMPHALRVRWIDSETDWLQTEGIVFNDNLTGGIYTDATLPTNPLYESVEFPGITDWINVHKAARFQLAQALLRPETHTLNADIESLRLERGDKVIVSTETLLIGTGYGRVTAVSISTIPQTVTVDSRVIMEAGKSYQIKFTLSDGTFLPRRVLNNATETDVIQLDSADAPPPPTMQSVIVDQEIGAGLKLLLEAGTLQSWPGKGIKWLDAASNVYDFYRGDDGTVEANDPTFIGVPGRQTWGDYWSFNGSSYFTSVNHPVGWVNQFHVNGAKGSAVFIIYIPTVGNYWWLCGNFANDPAKVGFEFFVSQQNTLTYRTANAGANGVGTYCYNAVSTTALAAGWHVVGFSIDENATPSGTCTFLTDGTTNTVAMSFTNPSAANPTHALQLGSLGGNTPTAAGLIMRAAAFWQGVALTATQMTNLRFTLVVGYDRTPPVGALFSFGELTKVTNDYRVLDVRPGPDLSAQFTLVDDTPFHDEYDAQPVPDYDPGITAQPDPFKLAPTSLIYSERFEGQGITAKSIVTLSVQIPRVGTIRAFEFQSLDVSTNGTWTSFAVVSAPLMTASKTNLEAGLYSFRVRALYSPDIGQAAGGSSTWVCSVDPKKDTCDIFNVLSVLSPPPDLTGGIRVTIQGDIMTLEWDPASAVNVSYYRVKYNSTTDGSATWGGSTELLVTTTNRVYVAARSGTYMVKAVTFSGIESNLELEHIVVTSAATPPNILQTFNEGGVMIEGVPPPSPIFPGYFSSTQVQGLLLTLAFNTKSVKQWITSLGLTANLKLVLDSGTLASWPGTGGQLWLDESGGGFDFFRGTDATATTNDPTFFGTAGAVNRQLSYWGMDGGDYFTYEAANPAWINAIHQDNAKATVILSVYVPVADGTPHYLCANTNSNTSVGFQCYINQNHLTFLVCNATGTVTAFTVSAATIAAGWHVLGFSIDETAGTMVLLIDGVTESFTGRTYVTPSPAAAAFTLQIGALGNGTGALANGYRIHAVAMWQGTAALTAAQMTSLANAINGEDALDYVTNSGFYQFRNYIDLGAVYTSRITAHVAAAGISAGDTMAHWPTLAGVQALDTSDPSSWSIETQYLLSDGPTGKKSVMQRITELTLTTGLKLVLETGTLDSWPGTGQKWLDSSPSVGDFFLGLDGTVTTNDPTFIGTTGTLLRTAGYWRFDGGDYFTYQAANAAWMNAIHQNNAKFSMIFSVHIPTNVFGVNHFWMCGDESADPAKVGFEFIILADGRPYFRVANATGTYGYQATGTTLTTIKAAGWHTVGISVDEAAGTVIFMTDGVAETYTNQAYVTPSALAATHVMQLGTAGNGAGLAANGCIMAAVAMWQTVSLTSAQMISLGSGIQHNDDWVFTGGWVPFSVTDVTARIIVFGIRLYGSVDGLVTPAVSSLGVTIDMPDRHLGYENLVTTTTAYTITFDPPFKALKSIALANYDLDTSNSEKYEVLSQDAKHVTILFSKGGLPIPGKHFSLHAYGYGAVISP